MKNSIKPKTLYIMTCFIITFVLVGCVTNPLVTSGMGTQRLKENDDFVKYLKVDNSELAKKLNISSVKSRQANNLLEVNVDLSSRYEKSLKLQYQFNWFDQQGFAVEVGKSPWQFIELHGFQSSTLRGIAPSEAVVSFNIYTREVPEKAYKF